MKEERLNVEYLLGQYKPGWSLEQAFYTSEKVFDAEWKYIFQKHWLFAGNTAQIPKAALIRCWNSANDRGVESIAWT